ncbi:MAG: phosphoribosylaminoimidazolesuccinocarboxamide synthase [Ilumatobacteraceae bacterium]|nr:phosphoribosylaminoimidazolesuccinocarboxamide synthase [Ilumatobacteraceae bacterium]
MSTISGCSDLELPLADRRTGKVRVSYSLKGNRRLFLTTDRLSAFDHIVAVVPFKGQVLNELSAWWFENSRHIVQNHFINCPDPNATIGHAAIPLAVEVVVRGVMTGSTSTSLWRQYSSGAREIYGYEFPDGLQKNTVLPRAIITPTTKGDAGGHDEPLTCTDVVTRGIIDQDVWNTVQQAALSLFAHGQKVAEKAGLLLADTKYEFGLAADGSVMLIDEMHTPDSSRYWELQTYRERLDRGEEPESLDKEPVRLALDALGYSGNGNPSPLDDAIISATTQRYIAAYTRLTGRQFVPGDYPVQQRLEKNLQNIGAR